MRQQAFASVSRKHAAAAAGALAALAGGEAFAADPAARITPALGQPVPGGMGMQSAGSPLRLSAMGFHDAILLPIIVVITLFVLALLTYVVIKFNKRANPTPARFSHNTPVEVMWTVAPVLILMFISIFSFRLLFNYHNTPKAEMTVKVTGNQWYWNYEYPDLGGVAFDSNILPEKTAHARGVPYKLAVDNPLVVPAGKTVKVLITGADVLHSFFIPSFGVQNTAVPGRVNETWFRADRPGVYYGQCNELCGVQHAFMPIEVDVVDQVKFKSWLAAHRKGGTKSAPAVPAGRQPAAKTVAVAQSPARV